MPQRITLGVYEGSRALDPTLLFHPVYPHIEHIINLVIRVEKQLHGKKEPPLWNFLFYSRRFGDDEESESVGASPPQFVITISNRDERNLFGSWTMCIDNEGDFWVKKSVVAPQDVCLGSLVCYGKTAEYELVEGLKLRGY